MRAIALDDVTAADRCGGKAAALGALRRAGLPVPDGFALGHDVFAGVVGVGGEVGLDDVGHAFAAAEAAVAAAAIPAALEADVRARAAALGRVAVRSSMSVEDVRGGAGAGVFRSIVDVAGDDVWDAIRAVWASAFTPLAIAYARRRGGAAGVEIGVIVQRFVPGPRLTVYTRRPGAPDVEDAWVQRDDALVPAAGPALELARRAAHAIGAREGADVELIDHAGGLVVVQARPIVHPQRRARVAPPAGLFTFTRATSGIEWRWDAAHNPSPLSPAQAGLVERVDAAGVAPYRMRVVAGYLYAAQVDAAPPVAAARDAAALIAIVDDALARAIAALEAAGPAPSVAAAIAAYVAFYRIWAREAGPPIAATRRAVARDVPAADPAWRPRGSISERIAAGDALALAAVSPAWDVAAPTVSEQPAWLEDARAIRASRPAAPVSGLALDEPRALAAAVAMLAERDDLAFARAQAVVRRALLADAARRGLDPVDDVFWLPLDEIADPAVEIDPIRARARAHAARGAATRAKAWEMPVAVVDGSGIEDAHAHDPDQLRGTGFGPRVAGRVILIDDLTDIPSIPPGAILVVPAVTPSLALFAQAAAAIVADHGGPLDHGAALARELAVPYVIARGATRALAPGDSVIVDGDAGTITTTAR